jgi:hypothetical protein
MEHIDSTLPCLRRFIHALLNEISTCTFQDEDTLRSLNSKIDGLWKFNLEQPDDANAVLLWYVLKSLEDWIPNEQFECGWSEQLKSHDMYVEQFDSDDLDCEGYIPDYEYRNPRVYFPNMSENVNVGWREIFETHIICMNSYEFEDNTHLRILLQSDQDIPHNRIIEIMPSELTENDIATLELNYLEQLFLDDGEHTKLRFSTNQLTWILSNWIRKNGRNSAPHFVHVPEHPAIKIQERLETNPQPPESELLREYIHWYWKAAWKSHIYSHPFEPRPPIPEKYPIGSKLHPIFHIRTFDDGRPSTGLFVGMILTHAHEFPQSVLLEANDFIEYDEETKEYLDTITKPERFPYAGYASILIGQKDVIVLYNKKIAWTFSKIETKGWESFVNESSKEDQFILDLNINAFGVKEFQIPEKYRKRK